METAVFIATLFLPAGTFRYWQGWIFLAVFAVSIWIPGLYLIRANPAAVRRRARAGPLAETRMIQKIAVSVLFILLTAMIVVSVLDHRFGWSSVPTAVCVLGDALTAVGLIGTMLVVVQNGYAAATVTVEAGQTVASRGLYSLVRHPMYTAALVMTAGIPPALGSYWGLVLAVPILVVLVVRIGDEEQMLSAELTGYLQYTRQVRYRLLPGVW